MKKILEVKHLKVSLINEPSKILVNDISLEDKTDSTETKMFNPKNVFEASDYMIDRLALLFERERQDLKKAS